MSREIRMNGKLQSISHIIYFLVLVGIVTAIALTVVAFVKNQSARSKLDKLQETLLYTSREIALQKDYMLQLHAWANDMEALCNDPANADTRFNRQCDTNPSVGVESPPEVTTDLGTVLEQDDGSPWEILAFLIVTAFTLLMLIVYGLLERARRERLLDLAREEYMRGRKEGLRQAVETLDADASVIRNAAIWLHNYQLGRGDADTAAGVFQQFLARLESQFKVKSMGRIGDRVSFDIRHHRTHQAGLQPGDEVKIIEPGWRLNGEVIRKPLVGR